MRLLIANRHMDDVLGGSEIQCNLIATNFIGFQDQVIYLALEAKKEIRKEYQVIGMPVFTKKLFENVIIETKPDVIYWRYNRKHLKAAVTVAKKYNIRFIYSLSHINDVTRWTWNWEKNNSIPSSIMNCLSSFKQACEGAWNYSAIQNVDGVVSLQRKLLDYLPKKFNNSNSLCIYNSMLFLPTNCFSWKRPYITWVANIKTAKRPEKYIELAERLKDTGVDFLMIGKIQDDSYNYIKDSNNLPSNLYYLGPKPVHEVDEILSKSLLMVHTCSPEGFGNNFIQAWYAGIPTVTLEFDPDDIIRDNNFGFSCNNDFEKLVNVIRKLIEDKKLREEIGYRTSIFANKMFDSELNAKRLKEFLNS